MVKTNRTFSSGLEILDNCGLVKPIEVRVSYQLDEKLRELQKTIKDIEWMGYLVGKEKGGKAYLTDLIFPKQVGSGGGVDDIEPLDTYKNVIGTVHYFPGGLHWSDSDENTLRGNHNINLVYYDGNYLCKARLLAPCGHQVAVEGYITVENRWGIFLKECSKKLTRQQVGRFRGYPYYEAP